LEVQKYWDVEPKVRNSVHLQHLSPPVHFGVHNSSIQNLERAIKERVFFVKSENGDFVPAPAPKPHHFEAKLSVFRQQLIDRLPSTTPIQIREFPLLYTGRKRTIYENAVQSLMHEGVSVKDSKLKAFVKAEKINFTAKGDPVPRVIQPRDPRYNVELGCFLKPVEKQLYKAINRVFGSTTIMKGLNAESAGRVVKQKWDKFSRPVAVGLDASRFDQHVSVDALKWEHAIHLRMTQGRANKLKLSKLLAWQLDNRGVGYCRDGKLRYSVKGKRMSGDMNTGSGNCLLMCAMIYSYCFERKISNYELMNNGDDCVVIMEQRDLERFQQGLDSWFLGMGFSMKVEEPVKVIEQIEFCQTHPVFDGCKYVMVRNLKNGLSKDCLSLTYNDTINSLFHYYRELGEAGLHLTGGIPIWQEFYNRLLGCVPDAVKSSKRRSNVYSQNVGMMMLADGMHRKYADVTAAARFSFYLAFGVTPDEQRSVESYYENVTISFDKKMACGLSLNLKHNFPNGEQPRW
jgi:hypothetical protein